LLSRIFQSLYDGGGQQGNHDLVVAGQGKALAALGRGSLDHVLCRAVVLDKVHVEGDEVFYLMS